jgi:NAD(P)-dependent dehydrogenase (short-subunit alcohol dehydrogenase family)
MIDLSGHTVLVTGVGGGIGRGIADAFLAAGAAVVGGYHRREPTIGSPDDRWLAVSADLTTADGPGRLIEAAVERFGRLDAVVNNAARQDLVPLATMTDDQFQVMIDTNLTTVHRLTQRAMPELAKTGGSVVHIASIEGSTPAPAHAHYAVSKAAVVMAARAAALEYGPLGVRVNSVSPGLIDRPGLADDWPEGVERWQRAAPLARLGTPADVARACLFLCSPLASWITGIDLTVDGGVSANPHW